MRAIKRLTLYPKGVLLGMLVMVLVFSVLYPITLTRVGFAYRDAILVPAYEQDRTVYTGKVQGETAVFTVSDDHVVSYQWGDAVYGPYTAREDPSAIPQNHDLRDQMTGVEVRQDNDVLFRGGVVDAGSSYLLYNTDGTLYWDEPMFVVYNTDLPYEESAPAVNDILQLLAGPVQTHHGTIWGWVFGVLLCAINAVAIVFADTLFRWRMSFVIRDAEQAQPAEWELLGRRIGWAVLALAALGVFVLGLA